MSYFDSSSDDEIRITAPGAHAPDELSVGRLYLDLACSRAATIQEIIEHTSGLPDPPAIVLTLAAAELAHATGAAVAPSQQTARAASVARKLIAEAGRHDPQAGALAERALHELEDAGAAGSEDLVHEAVDSLAWACAVLRRHGADLEDSEDGNADQLELAWLCLIEAAELLIALDRGAIHERERARRVHSGDGGRGRGDGRASTR